MNWAELRLVNGLVTLVDDADYATLVAAGPWQFFQAPNHRVAYARRTKNVTDGRPTYMHKFLTGWPLTDHINGDGLDNRRENLRRATPTQNNANCGPRGHNTSGYKGVSLRPDRGNRWRATIRAYGHQRFLGLYNDINEAARAYDAAAVELFGEFARLNFPLEVST